MWGVHQLQILLAYRYRSLVPSQRAFLVVQTIRRHPYQRRITTLPLIARMALRSPFPSLCDLILTHCLTPDPRTGR